MTNDQIALGRVRHLVGRSYADFDCWGLVREIFGYRGIALPEKYHEACRDRRMIVVAHGTTDALRGGGIYVPKLWDIPVFRTFAFVTLHVGVCLGGREFIHALDHQTGVSIGYLDRAPWSRIVAGFLRVAE